MASYIRETDYREFDKVTYPKDKCLYTNKRFLITEDAVNEQGIMARTMTYLNKLYVDTPVGADISRLLEVDRTMYMVVRPYRR